MRAITKKPLILFDRMYCGDEIAPTSRGFVDRPVRQRVPRAGLSSEALYPARNIFYQLDTANPGLARYPIVVNSRRLALNHFYGCTNVPCHRVQYLPRFHRSSDGQARNIGNNIRHVQIRRPTPVSTRTAPGIERKVRRSSISESAFRLLDSRTSLVSSLIRRVGSPEARSDASFTALWRTIAPIPIVVTAAIRQTARAISEPV